SAGNPTSSTITSGAERSTATSAAPPSAATVTSKPSATSVRSSIRRRGGSSSTTRTRSGLRPAVTLGSATCDVAPQEDQERCRQRRDPVHRADPCCANDRRPVDRGAQQALPGIELRAQQIRLNAAEPREDPDQLEQQ